MQAQDVLIERSKIPSDLMEFFEPAACGVCYVCSLVEVFRQVWRVLRDDGVCWLNLGDSYASNGGDLNKRKPGASNTGQQAVIDANANKGGNRTPPPGLKPKDLIGIPWRVAFALQADGWWLRSDIVWNKPNCMPESVTDRPTRSHEYIFLLTKAANYYYDADAIREDARYGYSSGGFRGGGAGGYINGRGHDNSAEGKHGTVTPGDGTGGRNRRTVWTIPTSPYPGAHFATFPEALVEPCILAGSSPQACEVCGAPWERVVEREGLPRDRSGDEGLPEGMSSSGKYKISGASHAAWKRDHPDKDLGRLPTCRCSNLGTGRSVILDPFFGSGTTGKVALKHGRDCIGIELNEQYISEQAEKRTDGVQTSLVGMLT